MTMKRFSAFIFFSLTVLIGHDGYGQNPPATKLTLQQCVEAGIAYNLDVQQSDIQRRTNKINWDQSRLNRLPDLNGVANAGINQGRSIDPFTNSYITDKVNYSNYGISSSVILFNGFSLNNSVKQNALAYEASKMDWQQAKDNVTINIILAYLQVLSNQDLLTQAINQAELSKKQVERLDILNKDGAIQPSLFYDLKGQYANDQLSIISTQNALETSKVNLAQLMNVPYDKNIELERLNVADYATLYEADPSKIYQQALQQFAQVKAVDLRTQSAEKGVKVARGQLFPTLGFNGNAGTNYSSVATRDVLLGTSDVASSDYVLIGTTPTPVFKKRTDIRTEKINYGKQLNNNVSTSFSLDLQIPLFNGLFARNRVKLAQLGLKNNDLVAKATKTQLQQSIEQAYINMSSASERYKTLLVQVSAFNESFRAAEARFDAGVGTSIDYLTAKNNLDRANINVITAKYDYVLRTKILDYYQGKKLW